MTKFVRNPVNGRIFGVIGSLLLIAAMPAWSSTPDGETPAEETVCDGLHDATPGLYGLCVAYCEAQDCDFESATSAQCNAPNPKLLDIYEKKRSDDDPSMPCVVAETEDDCPCFTAEELSALDIVSCDEIDWDVAIDTTLSNTDSSQGAFIEVLSDGFGRCMYRDDWSPQGPVSSDSETNPVQTSACKDLVDAYIERAGLVCSYSH